MRKIMDNLDLRFLFCMALMVAYAFLLGFVIKLLGLACIPIALICVILVFFAVCYTMQAIDSYCKSKDEGISFKDAWKNLQNDYDECI